MQSAGLQSFGFGVQGIRDRGTWIGVQRYGFRVQRYGFQVQRYGFSVRGTRVQCQGHQGRGIRVQG